MKGILKSLLFGAIVLNVTACSQKERPKQRPRLSGELELSSIINGREVQASESFAHSTVAFYIERGEEQGQIAGFCTGTLIARNVVLTAAHCFADVAERHMHTTIEQMATKVRVGFGLPVVSNINNSQIPLLTIKKVIVHPNYKVGSVNSAQRTPMPDVAIVQLNESAPQGAVPAQMVTDPNVLVAGLPITLVGFGVTDAGSRTRPKQMMKVEVNVFNPRLTEAQFIYKIIDGRSACSGDSGGPAYLLSPNGASAIIGITSWGDGNCSRVGAYTSVPAFAAYINSVVASL